MITPNELVKTIAGLKKDFNILKSRMEKEKM
jgi:hypothetical protein